MEKEEIREFEKELENYRQQVKLERPIEFYGYPSKIKKGYVFNEILGACHWSVVQYCIDNRILDRRGDRWVLIGQMEIRKINRNETKEVLIPVNYFEFKPKWDGLQKLNRQENYARLEDGQDIDEVEKALKQKGFI